MRRSAPAHGGRRRRLEGGVVVAARPHERASPLRPAPLEQRRRSLPIAHQGRAEAPVERRGDRELVPGADLKLIGERRGPIGRRSLTAEELVDGGELAADPGGLPAGRLDAALGVADALARSFETPLRLVPGLAGRLNGAGQCGDTLAEDSALALEFGQLAGELGVAVTLERLELFGQGRDPGLGLGIRHIGVVGFLQTGEAVTGALDALVDRGGAATDRLDAVADPLAGGLGLEGAPRELVALGGPRRQRLLGRLTPLADRLELRLEGGASASGLGRFALGGLELQRAHPHVIASELPTRLEALALEPGMELCRLGLALERFQPQARLAFDVERAVKVVLSPLQLQLGAAPAFAVLAETGRLLDQQAAVPRLGRDDRLDPALGDDRMHLLPHACVRQQLDHVDEAAPGSRQAVLTVACAVQAAEDRDFRRAEAEDVVGVVEDEFDLGALGRLTSRAAAKDDVLHRLAADGERRLLAERPQDRVGHVRLPGPIRADDHTDAAAELEPRAVGKGFEALQSDRLQVHGGSSRGAVTTASPRQAERPPARRPSCCGPSPARSRRRRSRH